MASINCVEINVANNAELCANTQNIFAFTHAAKPPNIFKNYKLKLFLGR